MFFKFLTAAVFLISVAPNLSAQAIRVDVDEFTAGGNVTEQGFFKISDSSLVHNFNGPVSALTIANGVFINAFTTVDSNGGFRDRGILNDNVPPGPLQNLLRDSIGASGAATIGIQINDLPGGKYLFNTYHHDWNVGSAPNSFDIFADDATGENQAKVVNASFSNDTPFDNGQQFQIQSGGSVFLRIVGRAPGNLAVFNGMQIIPITATISPQAVEFSETNVDFLDQHELLDEFLFYEIVYDGVSELKLDTFGTPDSTDTEIALFNAEGILLGQNDDIDPPNRHSELVFDNLSAGTYYLAVAGFNTSFSDGFLVQQISNSFTPGDVNVNVSTAEVPIIQQSFVLAGTSFSTSFDYESQPGSVDFFEIEYDGVSPITIDTNGSVFDTELGLYDAQGLIIATDDDGGFGLQSQLTCLSDLPAGTYYLALGGFNTDFQDNFAVTTNSTLGGFANVNINSETPATVGSFITTGPGYVETDTRAINPHEFFFFNLQVNESSHLTIDTNLTSEVDTHIALFNTSGDLITENNDANGSEQSELNFDSLPAGSYFLAVSGSTNFQDCFGVFTEHEESGTVITRVAIDAEPQIPGDINCDGQVNLLDVSPFIDFITNGDYSLKADLNEDGFVNLLDVEPFVDLLSGS